MAGSVSLAFNILAKDQASSTLSKVGGHVEATGKRVEALSKGFSKFGGIIGGEVGEALDKVGEAFEKVGEKQHKLGSALTAGGAAITGIGALLSAMGSKDKAAMQQLDAAVTASGKGFDGFKEEVEKAVKSQENFGHTAPDTVTALRVLTQATGDPKKALEEMNVVSDLAAAKHETLAEAALQVAKVYGGSTRILKEFGLSATSAKVAEAAFASAQKQHEAAVTKLKNAEQKLHDIEMVQGASKKHTIQQEIQLRNARQAVTTASEDLKKKTSLLTTAQKDNAGATHSTDQALSKLGDKLKGQAAASVNTFTGRLDVMKVKIEDNVAAFGKDFGGAITAAGPILMGLGAVVTLFNGLQEARAAKTLAAAAATDVETASTSGNVVALLASKVASVASTAATGAMTAAQWLLNAALDANPIGIVVLALAALTAGLVYAYKHSQTFRDIVSGAMHYVGIAFDFVKDHWKIFATVFATLLGGPILGGVVLLVTHFGTVKAVLTDVFSKVGSAASAMWNNVLRPTFKFIMDLWLTVASAIIHGAADAFGWVPGIGPKLKSAAKQFDAFSNSVNRSLSGIQTSVHVNVTADLTLRQTDQTGRTIGGVTTVGNRASGGMVLGGAAYRINEQGPDEVFQPYVNGRILNRGQQMAMANASSAPSEPVVVKLYLDGKQIHSSLLDLRRNRGQGLGLA